jgi:hypothetical protein
MAGILSARNENGSLRRSGRYFRSTIAASAKFQSISFEGSGGNCVGSLVTRCRERRVAPVIPAAGQCG